MHLRSGRTTKQKEVVNPTVGPSQPGPSQPGPSQPPLRRSGRITKQKKVVDPTVGPSQPGPSQPPLRRSERIQKKQTRTPEENPVAVAPARSPKLKTSRLKRKQDERARRSESPLAGPSRAPQPKSNRAKGKQAVRDMRPESSSAGPSRARQPQSDRVTRQQARQQAAGAMGSAGPSAAPPAPPPAPPAPTAINAPARRAPRTHSIVNPAMNRPITAPTSLWRFPMKNLPPPPPNWTFLGVNTAQARAQGGYNGKQLRELLQHWGWRMDHGLWRHKPAAEYGRDLWKVMYYMANMHRPQNRQQLEDYTRDAGPRLLNCSLQFNQEFLPVSRKWPDPPNPTDPCSPGFIRDPQACISLPDVWVERMHAGDPPPQGGQMQPQGSQQPPQGYQQQPGTPIAPPTSPLTPQASPPPLQETPEQPQGGVWDPWVNTLDPQPFGQSSSSSVNPPDVGPDDSDLATAVQNYLQQGAEQPEQPGLPEFPELQGFPGLPELPLLPELPGLPAITGLPELAYSNADGPTLPADPGPALEIPTENNAPVPAMPGVPSSDNEWGNFLESRGPTPVLPGDSSAEEGGSMPDIPYENNAPGGPASEAEWQAWEENQRRIRLRNATIPPFFIPAGPVRMRMLAEMENDYDILYLGDQAFSKANQRDYPGDAELDFDEYLHPPSPGGHYYFGGYDSDSDHQDAEGEYYHSDMDTEEEDEILPDDEVVLLPMPFTR